jgi:hypothetical protein
VPVETMEVGARRLGGQVLCEVVGSPWPSLAARRIAGMGLAVWNEGTGRVEDGRRIAEVGWRGVGRPGKLQTRGLAGRQLVLERNGSPCGHVSIRLGHGSGCRYLGRGVARDQTVLL